MDMVRGLARAGRIAVTALSCLALVVQGAAAQQVIDPAAAGQVAQTMARALQATEDGVLTMERDRWDPQWLADQLGGDPAALRRFLHDRVLWAPYAGALRGAEGVLMDRTANALDGALAMAALLQAAGFEVRLARAALPPEALPTLLAPAPADAEAAPPAISPEPLVAASETYGLDPAAVAAGLEAGLAEAADIDARQRLNTQALLLAAATGLPADPAPEPDVAAALADHWWAQYRAAEGWTDADWLTADGAAPVAPAETLAPGDLPAELYHRVRLSLSVEQVDGGAATQTRLVETELVPALGQGRRISLTHMPMDWPMDWAAGGPDEIQLRLRAAFATQDEWWPILTVDDQVLGPVSVRADGTINPDPSPSTNPFLPIGVSMAGHALEAADALRQGEDTPEALPSGLAPEPTGQFTAEWLDVEVTAPGAEPRRERRYIFDLVGPAARAAGTEGAFTISDEARAVRALGAMSETSLRVFAAWPAPEWLLYESATALLASRPVLDAVAADPFGKVPSDLSTMMSGLAPGPGPIEAFAASRGALNLLGGDVYQDRPMVVALHSGYDRDPASGDFLVTQALDIVDAGVGVRPGATVSPFLVRMFQGVADARAESDALGGSAAGNAGTAFDPADPAWGLVRAPADLPAAMAPAMAAQIGAALAEGYVAYAPIHDAAGAAAEAGAWWRIDPATGETLAMGPDGWGQAMVEWAFLLILKTLWAQIACMARVAAIRAASEAFDKGRVTLPKTAAELKAGTTDVTKACVREALLNQLTGMTAMIFVGLPGYGTSRLNNWAVGSDGWTAAPSYGSRIPGPAPAPDGRSPAAYTMSPSGARSPAASTLPPSGARSPAASTVPPPGARSPAASTVPPPAGQPQPAPAGPGAGRASPQLEAAAARELEAEKAGVAARKAYEANPTPENAAARDKAFDDWLQAGRDKINAWDGKEPMPHTYRDPATGDYYSAYEPRPAAPANPALAATQPLPGGGLGPEATGSMPGGVVGFDATVAAPTGGGAGTPQSPLATTVTAPAGGGFASTLTGLGAMGSALSDK